MKKVNILFVCLGNICRSPLAEGIFQQLLVEKGLTDQFTCDSCGTSDYHIGGQPDPRTVANAQQNGVTLNHKARQFVAEDFSRFDYIIPMDRSNVENVMRLSSSHENDGVVQLMRTYDVEAPGADVPDPYFGGANGFQEVFDILNRSCTALLNNLQQRKA